MSESPDAPPDATDLSILIVSYNTREMTLECLRSVYAQTAGVRFEIIVVDNDSSDDSAGAIEREAPAATLIRLTNNIGFAAANNLAALRARGKYLLLLNPDTVVLDGAVQKLVAFARRRPEAGIWGGRTVFADGRLNPTSCWMRQSLWGAFCRGMGLSGAFRRSAMFNPEAMGAWPRNSERDVDIVTGCFFLIRTDLWRSLGGFDPAFFMYGEEADLCLRARALGARPRVTPEATIIHHGGASETVKPDKLVRLNRARMQLIRRHWPRRWRWFGAWMTAQASLVHALAWKAIGVVRGGRDLSKAEYWWAGWARRREWLAEPPPAAPSTLELLAKGAPCSDRPRNGVPACNQAV